MDRAEQMRKAVLGLEKQLARSPAHFIHMEQWQGYKDGVQDYVKAIRALPLPPVAKQNKSLTDGIREAIRLAEQPHYGDSDTALEHYSEAIDILRKLV